MQGFPQCCLLRMGGCSDKELGYKAGSRPGSVTADNFFILSSLVPASIALTLGLGMGVDATGQEDSSRSGMGCKLMQGPCASPQSQEVFPGTGSVLR